MPRELHEVKDISLAQGADVLEAGKDPKTSLLPKTYQFAQRTRNSPTR